MIDGLVSYQSFALGAAEANPVVAAAIVNWGMIGGLVYNKTLACVLLLLIFALRRSRRLLVEGYVLLPFGLAAFLGAVFLTALVVWRVAPKWLG